MAAHLLEQPEAGQAAEVQEGAPQAPSILSVTNNHVIVAADVSLPGEDGSRLVKLISTNGAVVIDAALSPELCAYLAQGLVAVDVIEQEEEQNGDSADAG